MDKWGSEGKEWEFGVNRMVNSLFFFFFLRLYPRHMEVPG